MYAGAWEPEEGTGSPIAGGTVVMSHSGARTQTQSW